VGGPVRGPAGRGSRYRGGASCAGGGGRGPPARRRGVGGRSFGGCRAGCAAGTRAWMQALREEIGDEVTWQRLLARMAAGPQRFYPPWAQPTDTAAGAQRRAHSLGEFGQQLLALAGAEAADPAVRGNPGTLHHGRGAGRLEQLRLRRRDTGDTQTEPADGLFILIGAQPFTQCCPRRWPATSGASSSPAQTWPNAGPCRGNPTCSKPAHPACSPPATSGTARSNASHRLSARGRSPSAWFTTALRSLLAERAPTRAERRCAQSSKHDRRRVDRNGRRQEAASTAIRHQQASASPADAQNRPSEQHLQIRGSKSNPPRTARRSRLQKPARRLQTAWSGACARRDAMTPRVTRKLGKAW
jgi:hypothetical protein